MASALQQPLQNNVFVLIFYTLQKFFIVGDCKYRGEIYEKNTHF
jgi:hypothetical protein